jgi:RNA exonuclease 4
MHNSLIVFSNSSIVTEPHSYICTCKFNNRTMEGLSSNWKKLQAKLKADPGSKSAPKRKADEGTQQPAKKLKRAESSSTLSTTAVRSKATHTNYPMGGVHSSKIEHEPKYGISPSLALWAEDNDISTEQLAEAYGLGTKDPSAALASAKDRVNHGRVEGLSIGKYVAIDCEMVGVGPGGYESALARVSMVDFHGRQLYDSYVKPKERVTNWRTAVSGVSAKDMRFARDFEEVQKSVDEILQGRVLVGHDLKHDLEALKLSHPARDIRDTATYNSFKKYGNGRKPALRKLAQEILNVEIQTGQHSSMEDARVAMLIFRKHKSGFDMDNANRYASKASSNQASKGKPKKKRKG